MNVTPEMFLEACYPLGDVRHSAEVKKAAVRAVIIDRRSYRAAAREAGVYHTDVARWCDETEARIGRAQALARATADAEAEAA